LPPIWEPDAEPLDRTVKVRLSVRQLEHLDLAVKEFRMSRSRVLRESLALGFPLFVEKVRQRRRAGLVPRGSTRTRMRRVRGVGRVRTGRVRTAG